MLPSKGDVHIRFTDGMATYKDVADLDVREGFVVIQRWVKDQKKNKKVAVEVIPGARVLEVAFEMLAAHELWSR